VYYYFVEDDDRDYCDVFSSLLKGITKKEICIMRNLVYFILLLCVCIFIPDVSYAAEVRIEPQSGKIGTLLEAKDGYYSVSTTATGDYISYSGDRYGGFTYDLGVVKFEIASQLGSSYVIDSAYINGYCFAISGVYVKIQRYVEDNTTALGEADHPDNATLADVATVSLSSGLFSLDVTDAVAADVAAGKTYSSFLLTVVKDAQGTSLNGTPEYFYMCIHEGWSDATEPHLDVVVDPLVVVDSNDICYVSINKFVADANSEPSEVEEYAAEQLQAAFKLAGGGSTISKMATIWEIEVTASDEGYSSILDTTSPGTATDATPWNTITVGNNNSGNAAYAGVWKFEIPTLNPGETIAKAKFGIYGTRYLGNSGYDRTYFRLQHFTTDNTGAVAGSDGALSLGSHTVENIGGVRELISSDRVEVEWDVTDYITADANDGFTNSSYRIILTDPNGVLYVGAPPVGDTPYCLDLATEDTTSFDNIPGHLDIIVAAPKPEELFSANEGYASILDTTSPGTAGEATPWDTLTVGNNNAGNAAYAGVWKFEIPALDSGETIAGAKFGIFGMRYLGNSGYDRAYFRLQHFTTDNTGAVAGSDGALGLGSHTVENVGGVRELVSSDPTEFEWDVTEYINDDISNEFTNSSYRVILTDPNGELYVGAPPASGTPYCLDVATEHTASFTNIPGHLDITLLNDYLEQPIQIRLGVSDLFSEGVGDSNDHAYTIRRTLDDNIELVANTEAAVMWAVDDFCKQTLKISWPTIIDDTMVLEESQSTIAFDELSTTQVPDFRYRGWIISENTDGYMYNNVIGNWMAHNRQGTLYNSFWEMDTGGVYDKMLARGIEVETTYHSFADLVPADEYYDTHPEYFPLIDSVRVNPDDTGGFHIQLCISNSSVRSIILDQVTDAFDDYPELRIFGVAQNDGNGGWCECSSCNALDGSQAGTGNYSNRLIDLVNDLADSIASSYPGKCIGTYSYGETVSPPDTDVEDNVAITFCPAGRNFMNKLTDPCDSTNAAIMTNVNGWLNKADDVHFWEYYYMTSMDYCLTPFARTICEEFGDLKTLGLKGVCSQIWPSDVTGTSLNLLAYATARAGWDTSLDFEDDILEDYCDQAYGAASSYMKSYHLLYEEAIYDDVDFMPAYGPAAQLFPPAFTSTQMNTLEGYLDSAISAVGTDPNRIEPPSGKIGTLLEAKDGYYSVSTTAINDYISYSGDRYGGFTYDLGVLKLPLPSGMDSSDIIVSAHIKGYCFAISGAYVKIQRYANNNTANLGSSDHPDSASLVDVAIVPVSSGLFSWDVTDAVIADVAAGKTYSSFLLTVVKDAKGTPLNGTPEYFYMCIHEGWSYDTEPHLDVSTYHAHSVAEAKAQFEQFERLSVDPSGISGIGSNVVTNPGAEDSPDGTGWLTDIYLSEGDYTFSISTSVAHSGSNSFQITCTGDAGPAARWYQTNIPVTIGEKYAARFWVRAGSGADGVIELYISSLLPTAWIDSGDEWTRIIVPEFTATSSTISLFMHTSGTGTVYFDDIFIAELP
jgi:hypothetical protein